MGQYFGKKFTVTERWDDIRNHLERVINSETLLIDLGCAEGLISYNCAMLGATVKAYDNDSAKLEQAIRHKNISYNCSSVENIKLTFIKPDVTICNGVHNKLPLIDRLALLETIFSNTKTLVIIRTNMDYWKEVIDYSFYNGFDRCMFTKPISPRCNPALCFDKFPVQ